MDADLTDHLQSRVLNAFKNGEPLQIRGGGTKAFHGRDPGNVGVLETTGHRGILAYEPSELVITARGGTPLADIENALADAGQMLPFEPPHFGPGATIGGAVASGLCGPGRPWRGAVRDVLLGVRLLDGRGQVLKFGGQVMKNVAGYDLSRLMAGAMGTLGVLVEVSVRLLPRPRTERTLRLDRSPDAARRLLADLRSRPAPLSGACYSASGLVLRLAGHDSVLDAFRRDHGGDWVDDGASFWHQLRDHQLPFFRQDRPLWRLSVAPDTPPFSFADDWLADWGGAQHWLYTAAGTDEVRNAAAEHGGHAVLFHAGTSPNPSPFQPLGTSVKILHQRLKTVFDPDGILNPGRMYADW